MKISKDILTYLERHFPAGQQKEVIELLHQAVLHDGTVPAPRIIRCAVYAGRGDLDKLKYYLDLIAIDFRDVIVAGEYELEDGDLVRVRDLSKGFPAGD